MNKLDKSFIYWHPFLYRLIMNILYRKNVSARYEAISKEIPKGAVVIDVCCGDCYLFRKFLNLKNVSYTGLDINESFINDARKKGINVRKFDLRHDSLPRSEFIIMQASLYQFIPYHEEILEKLFAAATKMVIISEPIRNLSDSNNQLIKYLAKNMTNPGTGNTAKRFNEKSFQRLLKKYDKHLKSSYITEDGKEMVAFFKV